MWARSLFPYPFLPPSLINLTVSVDVKHHGKKKEHLVRDQDGAAQLGTSMFQAMEKAGKDEASLRHHCEYLMVR